jgi:ADP-ribosyl-[dinitrogen reductase] hydrolase
MFADKIAGTLIGLAVGDALGVPHEFKSQRHNLYTGLLHIAPEYVFRCGRRTDVIGQYSDDTEMALCIGRSIVENRGYNKEAVIMKYLEWASTSKAMGKNTRALFKGVKTLNGYQSRWQKIFGVTDPSSWTQSNGALMRCCLLAFLPNYPEAIVADCEISNPHQINIDAELVYCIILRYTAKGMLSKSHIINVVLNNPVVLNFGQEVRDVIMHSITHKEFSRDVKTVGKGWVLHGLYCAVWGWYHFDDYQTPIDIIIRQGGDTDTNAAIAGALIGANLGYAALMREERTRYNISVVRTADFNTGENPRPPQYRLDDFDQLVNTLAAIFGTIQ